MSTVDLSLLVLFILFPIKTFVNSQLLNQSDGKANLVKFRSVSSQFGLTKPLPFQIKPWLQDSWPYSSNWPPYPLSILHSAPAHLDSPALIAQHRLELTGPYEPYLENNPSPNLLPLNHHQFNDVSQQNFIESLKRAKKVAKSLQKYSKSINHLQTETQSQRRGCKSKAGCFKHSPVSDYTKFSDSNMFSQEDDEPQNEERFGFKFSRPFDSYLFSKPDHGQRHLEASFERERRKDQPYDYFNTWLVSKSNGYKKSYSKSPSWDEEDDEKVTDHSTHQDDYMNRYREPVFDDDQEESTEEPESQFQYSQDELNQDHRGHPRHESTKRSHNEAEDDSNNFYNDFKFKNGRRLTFVNPSKKLRFIDRTKYGGGQQSMKCGHKSNYHEDNNKEYDDHYSQYDDSGQGEESRKSKMTLNKDKNRTKSLSSNTAKVSSKSKSPKSK